jgi:2-polyprenyl-3-methyl-5-hydroxy-6-metoxy-1,4-benzoquinol methylase
MDSLQHKSHVSIFTETADIETSSEGYAGRFSGVIGEYFLSVQAKISLELLKDYPKATILDIGGGHGQLAVPLVKHGYNVTVTGSADVCSLRLDRLLPPASFEYITCDMLSVPFEDGHFDVVTAFRLLPHVRQWQKLISEMCRVSRKAIIFDYPDLRSFNSLYSILFCAKRALEGNTRSFRLFRRRQIIKIFQEHNFNRFLMRPQFFIPMVVHRTIKSVLFSKMVEFIFRVLGITNLFGSPIIVKATKQ